MVLLYQDKRTILFTDKDGDGVIEIFENADSNEVLSENHYYPFGMNMNGAWMSNKGKGTDYRFNGIERNEDFNLNWDIAEFRSYDAAIGRWMQVDPLAEISPGWTPYRNAFNNPLSFIDPLGLFETRREARRERRQQRRQARKNDERWEGAKIVKNSEGRFELRYKGSDGYVTRNSDGQLEYGAVEYATNAIRPRKQGFWEKRKEGGPLSQVLYGMANGINVFARQPFYGRGDAIPTLDGFSVIKGSNEGINTGLDGLLTIAPLPIPKGTSVASKSASISASNLQMVEAAMLKIRRINGGVLINNQLRIQVHKHSLNPIKGRGYPGSIKATHLNINKFHVIFNPTKWDALSTWRYTPFRFKN